MLASEGYRNIRRSKGSRGPADLYARKGGRRYYYQVKTGRARASQSQIRQLRALAQKRGGVAGVITYNKGKKIQRFYGNWS